MAGCFQFGGLLLQINLVNKMLHLAGEAHTCVFLFCPQRVSDEDDATHYLAASGLTCFVELPFLLSKREGERVLLLSPSHTLVALLLHSTLLYLFHSTSSVPNYKMSFCLFCYILQG